MNALDSELNLKNRAETSPYSPRRFKLPTSKRGIAALLLITAVPLATWFHYGSGNSAAGASTPAPAPEVMVSTPLVRTLDSRLDLLGQLSAVDQVELRAQVGGTLTGIHFKDGAIVHRGQMLFTIDPRPFEIRLSQARAAVAGASAKLALANRELERARALQQGDAGTVQNVEQRIADQRAAEAMLTEARAQVRDAEFDLEHSRITAPFTGKIGTHLVSVGTLVAGSRAASSPTTLLATMVSLDPVHMDFDMSEADYGLFSRGRLQSGAVGDPVMVAPNGEADFTRPGTLDFIDNAIDRSSGTIRARATVANPKLDLTPGGFAKVRLAVTKPVPTLLVPDTAVLPDQSNHMVLTVGADGKVAPKQVETGELRGGLRVIRSGLTARDRVIIDGIPYATPGTSVTAKAGSIRFSTTPQS